MNKKNIILLIIAIIILAISIVFLVFTNRQDVQENSNTVQKSPETKTELTFSDDKNNNYKLSNFSNKPIALILWNSDSENSLDIIQLVQKHYTEYSDTINFLIVNTKELNPDIQSIVKECNFIIPIYYDINSTATDVYSFSKLPTLIFFKENLEFENKIEANITEDSFLANLDLITNNY